MLKRIFASLFQKPAPSLDKHQQRVRQKRVDVAAWLMDSPRPQDGSIPPDLVVARSALPRRFDRFESIMRAELSMISFFHSAKCRHPDIPARLWPVFLFHGDGFHREAALNLVPAARPSPLIIMVVIRRLNDWAGPVRVAADRAYSRILTHLTQDDFRALLPGMACDMLSWQRRSTSAFDLVFLQSPQAVAVMIEWLAHTRQGPAARLMYQLLRTDKLDSYLPSLALEAPNPIVRQIAMRTLLTGQASWPDGSTWVWVDKSLGKRRLDVKISTRAVSASHPIAPLMEAGVADPSARVRRLIADHLIAHGPSNLPPDRLTRLRADKDPGVQDRIAFADRKWHAAGQPPA